MNNLFFFVILLFIIKNQSLPFLPNLASFKKSEIKFLQNWIIGDFENTQQAANDKNYGKPTAKDGGHELVGISIVPHPTIENVVIAKYFFNKDEKTPFRFRLYKFFDNYNNTKYSVTMKIYKPISKTAEHLKKREYNLKNYEPKLNEFEVIENCDLGWKKEKFLGIFPLNNFIGVLVNGEVKVPSQKDPNIILTVRDEIRLWNNKLWLNDQVYTQDGKQIIGNIYGIPYKFVKKISLKKN
jgi:hypothetical protein